MLLRGYWLHRCVPAESQFDNRRVYVFAATTAAAMRVRRHLRVECRRRRGVSTRSDLDQWSVYMSAATPAAVRVRERMSARQRRDQRCLPTGSKFTERWVHVSATPATASMRVRCSLCT